MNAAPLPSKKPARVKAVRPKPNYNNGKIYKISNVNNTKYYIGSTFKRIEQRLKEHITSYKAYLTNNDKTYLSSYKILQHSDYYIELLELYPCNTKAELHRRERQRQE